MDVKSRHLVRSAGFFLVSFAGLYLARRQSYLLFHGLAEQFSIIIACGVFMVAWNARRFHLNNYLTLIGVAYLWVAVLDLLHTLAYKGMGVFPEYDSNLPTQLWIAARSMEALSLLLAPLLIHRKVNAYLALGVYAVITGVLIAVIFRGQFPDCYIEGQGLTPFKRIAEYVICGVLAAAVVLFWIRRSHFDRAMLPLVLASLAVTIASELAFTFYEDPYGPWNWVGHLLKIASFYFMYKAVIETGLARPFDLLFRDADQARAAAEAASAAKDRFLAVLSHELRNPLNPVLMAVSALESRRELAGDVREDLQLIRRNVELEARLIDDLLDLTRIARGKLELARQATDAHELLRHAVAICEADAAKKQLRMELDLRAQQHQLDADPVRIQQVFWNVIKNAVKFTPANGRIEVRSSNPASPSTLAIDVIDNGKGIEPHLLPRVFDAFEQGDPAITRQFGGLGLGLAISRALVELHGGTIIADSAGPGRGARFRVTLPTVEAPGARISRPDTDSGRPAPLKSRHILLVEDHEDTRHLLGRLLESHGYTVTAVGSFREAVEAAERNSIDLVISDLGLPDGDGRNLMRRLREQHGLRGIALSGYGMEADIENSLDAGFEAHVTKPVVFEHLLATIHRSTRE